MTIKLIDLTKGSPTPFAAMELPVVPRKDELIQLPELRYQVKNVTYTRVGGNWEAWLRVAPEIRRI